MVVNITRDVEKAADESLEAFDDVCNILKIKYFLALGTCLGIYRDGKYINADNDIDVGVLCQEHELGKLQTMLKERGFVNYSSGKKGIVFDILYKFHWLEKPFLKTLDTVNYKGRVYNVPHPVEDYLMLHYGCYGDWRTHISRIPWIKDMRAHSIICYTGCYKPVIRLEWLI